MLAVFKTGGKQYSVKTGQILKVEKLEGNKGDNIRRSTGSPTPQSTHTRNKQEHGESQDESQSEIVCLICCDNDLVCLAGRFKFCSLTLFLLVFIHRSPLNLEMQSLLLRCLAC